MKWIFLIGNETFNVETVKKLKHADMVCSYDRTAGIALILVMITFFMSK